MFVIRRDNPQRDEDGVTLWLRSTFPVVRWGTRDAAKRFKTRSEAFSIMKKVRAPRGSLTLEEADAGGHDVR